jgi:hypothetical protein
MWEILSFSLTKLFSFIYNPDNWDSQGLVTRNFYDGEEFNDRQLLIESEPREFLDSTIIYTGIVDKNKMSFKKQSPDELFTEIYGHVLEPDKVL